jgi:hypothetical protein
MLHDLVAYVRMRGYSPTVVLECRGCPTKFQAKDGVAFPAVSPAGEPTLSAFCCTQCYLNTMPIERMWRA